MTRTPQGRRGSGVETRAQLLQAARKLGAVKPFSAITVEDITNEAGTSRATFYLYFENKGQIYLELASETCELLFEAAGHSWRGHTPLESITLATRGYVTVFMANADVLRLLYTVGPSDERFGRLLRSARRRFHERIERGLKRGIQEGLFRRVDAKFATRALGGMVENFCVRQLFGAERLAVEQSVEVLSDLWFHAITAE